MTVKDVLEEGRVERSFDSAAVCVLRGTEELLSASVPADLPAGAAFDVASVTKVQTAVLAHRHLPLERRVEWIASRPTIGELLSHCSGLPAWRPLFAHAAQRLGTSVATLAGRQEPDVRVREIYREIIAATPCEAARPTYSDLGFFALGLELEAAGIAPGLDGTGLLPPPPMADRIVTGAGRPRRGNPRVEEAIVSYEDGAQDPGVDDDNAAVAGGVCGHAGAWGTARRVAALGELIRRAADEGEVGELNDRSARLMFTKVAGSRTYGLDTPSGDLPSIGTLLGRGPKGAAGHLGFTGCSLWIDRDARVSIAVLSNAVVYERPSTRIRAFRPRLHDAIARELGLA